MVCLQKEFLRFQVLPLVQPLGLFLHTKKHEVINCGTFSVFLEFFLEDILQPCLKTSQKDGSVVIDFCLFFLVDTFGTKNNAKKVPVQLLNSNSQQIQVFDHPIRQESSERGYILS